MRGRSAAMVAFLFFCAGCDRELVEPGAERDSASPYEATAGVVGVSQDQFAVDFRAYQPDQPLHDADWTRAARWWPLDSEPIPGDWRAWDVEDSPSGRVAALVNTPLASQDRRALLWDGLPDLSPPVEILVHLWIPPAEHHPRVGLAWFVQEPDHTGQLNGFVLVRNALGSVNNAFFLTRMYENVRAGTWFGPFDDGLDAGGWAWIRLRHTVETEEGTIRYRVWQGALDEEPSEWAAKITSTWFGPHGGTPGPGISGRAGLYVTGSENMEGIVPLWGAFTVGLDGAPAPPPPSGDEAVVLSIESARGPNDGGSFTSAEGENVVTLIASVSPDRLAEDVIWTLNPHPDYDVPLVSPDDPPPGSESSFIVPLQDVTRWHRDVLRDVDRCKDAQMPDCAPDLRTRSLAFEVGAFVTDGAASYTSAPAEVAQDEIDTIRQEYLDFLRGRTPPRTALANHRTTHFSPAELNRTGHYGVYWAQESLREGLENLREVARLAVELRGVTFNGLYVTSGYRNPVHHTVHEGSEDPESFHQYGLAADLRIWNHEPDIPRRQFFDLLGAAARRPGVGACFLPYRTPVHAHVDWRGDCPTSWREE